MAERPEEGASESKIEEAEQQRSDAFVPPEPPPGNAANDSAQPLNSEGTGTPLKPGRRGKYAGKTAPTNNV
jgi:hypothetical protein